MYVDLTVEKIDAIIEKDTRNTNKAEELCPAQKDASYWSCAYVDEYFSSKIADPYAILHQDWNVLQFKGL